MSVYRKADERSEHSTARGERANTAGLCSPQLALRVAMGRGEEAEARRV